MVELLTAFYIWKQYEGRICSMKQTYTMKEKIQQLLIVLIPILITQLGLFGMNFTDTIMSGQAGSIDLAGVAIGSSLWVPIFTGLNGILMALTPIISQDVGAQKEDRISFAIFQGLYLAIAISALIIIAGFFFMDPILKTMDITDQVRGIAKGYLIGLAFGIVPLFTGNVFRSFIDSLGYTRVTMIIILLALPLNIFFNYVLIFGKWGFPRLGGIGAGYATAITYWFIFFITIYFVVKVQPFRQYKILEKFFPVSLSMCKELLRLGVPIGFSVFFETAIFSAVTLLMSQFDTITIAAHQAAINFATLLYMVPMSVAFALTILVGHEVGAKRIYDAKLYGKLGLCFAVLFALVSSLILFFLREQIAMLYTQEMNVALLISQFLIYAIFFQFSDALATPIQGVLRGYKDVNIPFVTAFISYWIIGLPVGYILANYTSFGPFGYWLGLIIGLACGAVILMFRLVLIQNKYQKLSRSEG